METAPKAGTDGRKNRHKNRNTAHTARISNNNVAERTKNHVHRQNGNKEYNNEHMKQHNKNKV